MNGRWGIPFLLIAAFVMILSCARTTYGAGAATNDPPGDPYAQPDAVEATAIAITAGFNHTCALASSQGALCWGYNGDGQLGTGSWQSHNTPVWTVLTFGVDSIEAGSFHTCILTNTGTPRCWGRNQYGQLGNGNKISQNSPVNVVGLGTGNLAIAAGFEHSCVLTGAGAVKCWGRNDHGQLGNGTTTDSLTPVAVSGLTSGVKAIAAGFQHTCALTAANGVKCWGRNDSGQVGVGSTWTPFSTPQDVVGLTSGVKAITAGGYHTCAVTIGGAAKCWGKNNYGQLGVNSSQGIFDEPASVFLMTSGVNAITAGESHTCALKTSGGVKCWGWNEYGQVGDGTGIDRRAPVDVSGLTSGVGAVAAGDRHTCALTTAGKIKCWGYNGAGQLGDGTQTNRWAPVGVFGYGGSLLYLPGVLK